MHTSKESSARGTVSTATWPSTASIMAPEVRFGRILIYASPSRMQEYFDKNATARRCLRGSAMVCAIPKIRRYARAIKP